MSGRKRKKTVESDETSKPGKIQKTSGDCASKPPSSPPLFRVSCNPHNSEFDVESYVPSSPTSWLEIDSLHHEKLREHPFVGTWFPLKLHHFEKSDTGQTGPVSSDEQVALIVTLLCDNGAHEVTLTNVRDEGNSEASSSSESRTAAVDVRPNKAWNEETQIMELRINTLSYLHPCKSFRLHIRAADSSRKIMPAMSDAFEVVKYRLNIIRTGSEISTFYKDEGGKDKCFDLKIELLGRDGICGTPKGELIPFMVSAHYNNYELTPAPKMTSAKTPIPLLVCAGDMDHFIKSNGMGLVRCRINDVSKNHEKSGFRIKVSVGMSQSGPRDYFSISHGSQSSRVFSNQYEGIASGLSEPIVVRSKAKPSRAKAQKKMLSKASLEGSLQPNGDSSNMTSASLPRCSPEIASAIKNGQQVSSDVSIAILSEWGNHLTLALENVGKYLADFTMFTHFLTRPLLHQLADNAANSAPIVSRIVSTSDPNTEDSAASQSLPKLQLPRLSTLEDFDNIPPEGPFEFDGVGGAAAGAAAAAVAGALHSSASSSSSSSSSQFSTGYGSPLGARQSSFGYSRVPIPNDLRAQWSASGAFDNGNS